MVPEKLFMNPCRPRATHQMNFVNERVKFTNEFYQTGTLVAVTSDQICQGKDRSMAGPRIHV